MLAVQKSWNQPTHPVDRKLRSQRRAKQHAVAPVLKLAATLFQEISAVFQEFNILNSTRLVPRRAKYSNEQSIVV
jgi:hypothetical protein